MKKLLEVVIVTLVLATTLSQATLAQGPDPWPTTNKPCPILGCK